MAKSRKAKKGKQTPRRGASKGKNEFRRKLLRIAKASGAEEAFYMIPSKDVEMLFHTRFRSVRVEPASPDIPSRLLREVRMFLDLFLIESSVTICENGPEISVKDYLSVAQPLWYYLTDKEKFPCPPILTEKFARFIAVVEEERMPSQILSEAAGMITFYISRINRRLYWLEHKTEFTNTCLFDCLYLHSVNPERLSISVKDVARTVYRVGWPFPNHGMAWISVPCTDLQCKRSSSKREVSVYIQSHALVRLRERLDCMEASFLHFFLYLSLEQPKIQSSHGRRLIEYRAYDKKVGYLAFDLIDGIMVIRTFLFLTMDGTPEGENLRATLGLQATDKKYLEIDRLSTFIGSDIKENKELKEKFVQAGCHDLFALENNLNASLEIKKAGAIVSYLSLPSAEVA